MGGRNALRYGYTEDTAPEGTRWMYNALAPKEGTQYGDILPVARDADGTVRVAMPNALREGLLGMADLLSGVDTGELTGRGAASVTMGGVGTAMGLAPRGAIGMGGSKPPIRAYHGSPHDFDKFSLSKIGTGEGAQAYGHGLYFAENEGVARNYRVNLSGDPTINGRALNWNDPAEFGAAMVYDHGGNRAAAIKDLAKEVDYLRGTKGFDEANNPAANALRYLQGNGLLPELSTPGKMYEVAIHADPARFLDWDKPPTAGVMRGGQSETTGAILQRAYNNPMFAGDIVGVDRASPAELTKYFSDKGIPGIRYLDQGSRTAGDGSRNYVVFDDNLIEILRKYGLLAPAPVVPPQGNALNPAPAGNPLPNGLRRPEDREY